MNIIAKGGDGRFIETDDHLALGTIVSVVLPLTKKRELNCLNPTTGIVTAANQQNIFIQLLPDNHKELQIPRSLIREDSEEDLNKNHYQIRNSGRKISSQEQYQSLNRRSRDIEKSSIELAQLLTNDPEAMSYWRDYVYLKHSKAKSPIGELTADTDRWLKTHDWFSSSEVFNLSYVIHEMLMCLFGFNNED